MINATEIKTLLCDLARERKQNPDLTPLLAVFDLDSTLFEVSPRTQAILEDFSKHPLMQSRFPEETQKLSQVFADPKDWGIRPTLERSQIKATLDFFESFRTFWVEKFFSNDFLHHDQLYDGALEFVHDLHQAGAVIKYLTGRDQMRMGEGTLRVLKKWNFPLAHPETHLILKPHPHMEDALYKVDRLRILSQRYDEIWFFENEPVIIHAVRDKLPDIKVIFVDTIHSGQSSPPDGIPRIKSSFK